MLMLHQTRAQRERKKDRDACSNSSDIFLTSSLRPKKYAGLALSGEMVGAFASRAAQIWAPPCLVMAGALSHPSPRTLLGWIRPAFLAEYGCKDAVREKERKKKRATSKWTGVSVGSAD